MLKRYFILSLTLIFTLTSLRAQNIPAKDFGNSKKPVAVVKFLNNNTELLAGGFLKIWDINNTVNPVFNAVDESMQFENSMLFDADISNDGRYVATVISMRIDIYEVASRSIIKTFRGTGLAGVAFGPDNKLAYVSTNGNLKIFDVNSMRETFKRKFKGFKPFKVAWSGSGQYLAIGGAGSVVTVFDILEKDIKKTTDIGGKRVTDLEFSPDSKHLAVALAPALHPRGAVVPRGGARPPPANGPGY